ncbi:MAG: fumarate hydratase, partial [Clostridia bacterium]|nr:fumarate hydratase [Clostridia bacterium]
MREVDVKVIEDTVARLCVTANKLLPDDLCKRIENARCVESDSLARSVLGDLSLNLAAAKELNIPICQDTGMAVVFLDIGQDVHFIGGELIKAVNRGVAAGYSGGLLRKSVVSDPLKRTNTGDNTPAVIHTNIVPGESVKITVAPKGFGSENMSKIFMLTPADGYEGVINAVISAVKDAGSKPCPPVVVGVGIGGDFEQCAYLSKLALCRGTDKRNGDKYYADLENRLLDEINKLGIGPQGFGGN